MYNAGPGPDFLFVKIGVTFVLVTIQENLHMLLS